MLDSRRSGALNRSVTCLWSLCAAMTVVSASVSVAGPASARSIRLSGVVTPQSYKIFIEPDIEKGCFSGSETITVKVSRATSEIVLNAVALKLSHVMCRPANANAAPQSARVSYRSSAEQVLLDLPQALQPGIYDLSLQFDGNFNDKLRGFYRAQFTDANGHKQWLATTQMEPTDARRMLPCFDEPQYKATFALSTAITENLVALSNSPVASESTDRSTHRRIVRFAPTPKISSYLVALVIGPLVCADAISSDGVPVRVWTVPGREKLASFAQDTACNLLQFFNKYFAVAYPAKKLDLIAIPDFGPGAMENLGCITFRETYLLVDDKDGSTDAKQNVAITVAHEMAHMWFGDLVTMKWWDDLWLNEAFATWMSYKAVDHLRPEWHQWDNFCLERLRSMSTDALRSTRSIHCAIDDPTQVEQMFDEITYGKGASVLRMLERYVGENVFRDGVRKYIKAHQFANASTTDLWKSISAASGKEIEEIMHGWVYQQGYPLVSVSEGTNHALTVTQLRFFLDKSQAASSRSAFTWQIPLAFRALGATTSLDANARLADVGPALFRQRLRIFTTSGAAPYLVNAGGYGYFRVSYDKEALRRLSAHVQKLTALERMSLISDQYNLAVAGGEAVSEFMAMTAAFKDERDPNVTDVLVRQLQTDSSWEDTHSLELLVDDKAYPLFAAFVRDRFINAKNRLGWRVAQSDTDLTKQQRAQVLEILGTCGQDKETIEQSRELFHKYLDDARSIDPDLVRTVLRIVAFNGDASDYERIVELWHSARTPEREKDALFALSAFRAPALIQRTLALSLTEPVRRQDAPNLICAIAGTRAGRQLGWKFISSHWKEIEQRFDQHLMNRIIGSAAKLSTAAEVEEVKAFFKGNPVPSQSHTIAKAIESAEINAAFRQHSGEALSSWLTNQFGGAANSQL